MKNVFLRLLATGITLLLVGTGPTAAQSSGQACRQGGDLFLGDAFTVRYLIPVDTPAAEDDASGDPYAELFPNSPEQTQRESNCKSDGIVGALNCVASDMDAALKQQPGTTAGAESIGAEEDSESQWCAPEEQQYLDIMVTLQPVFLPGDPSLVALQPAGQATITGPDELKEGQLEQAATRLAAQMKAIRDWRLELDLDAMDPILNGDLPALSLPVGMGLEQRGPAATLRLPASCGSLFEYKVERAKLLKLRQQIVELIRRTEQQIEEQRGKNDDYVDRAENVFLPRERQRLAAVDELIAERNALINRRGQQLSKENQEIEIAEIRRDPQRLATEEQRRKEEYIAALRDRREHELRLAVGDREYNRHLAGLDAMANAARDRGNSELADAIAQDRERLQRARDQWMEQQASMLDIRYQEVGRLKRVNAADGIGPTEDALDFMRSEGLDYKETLEQGALEKAYAVVARQANYDAMTLGGTATDSYGASDFARDFLESNAEMLNDPRILVGLPPKLFVERYREFVKGAGKAVVDVALDAGYLAYQAGATLGEAHGYYTEALTGVDIGTGDETLSSLVKLGETVSELDASKVADELAAAADRKASQLAASGEKGIRDALYGTGYVSSSVLVADKLAMEGYLRARKIVSRGTRVANRACRVRPATPVADAAVADTPGAAGARKAGAADTRLDDTLPYEDADTALESLKSDDLGERLSPEEVMDILDANDAEPLLPGPAEPPPGSLSDGLSGSELAELFEPGRDLTPEQVSQKADLLRARERARRQGDVGTFGQLDERIRRAEATARGVDPEAPTQSLPESDTVRYDDADTIQQSSDGGERLSEEDIRDFMNANDSEPPLPGPKEPPPGSLSEQLSDSEVAKLFETGRDLTPEQVSQKADLLRARERARRKGDAETLERLNQRIQQAESAAAKSAPGAATRQTSGDLPETRRMDPPAQHTAEEAAKTKPMEPPIRRTAEEAAKTRRMDPPATRTPGELADTQPVPPPVDDRPTVIQQSPLRDDRPTVVEPAPALEGPSTQVEAAPAGSRPTVRDANRVLDDLEAEGLLPGAQEPVPGSLSEGLSDAELAELFRTDRELTPEQVAHKADLLRARARALRLGNTEQLKLLNERITNAEAAARAATNDGG